MLMSKHSNLQWCVLLAFRNLMYSLLLYCKRLTTQYQALYWVFWLRWCLMRDFSRRYTFKCTTITNMDLQVVLYLLQLFFSALLYQYFQFLDQQKMLWTKTWGTLWMPHYAMLKMNLSLWLLANCKTWAFQVIKPPSAFFWSFLGLWRTTWFLYRSFTKT